MNSFGSKSTLQVGNKSYEIFRIKALEAKGLSLQKLPYSLRVLLENLLRTEDGANVTADHIRALAGWDPAAEPNTDATAIASMTALPKSIAPCDSLVAAVAAWRTTSA